MDEILKVEGLQEVQRKLYAYSQQMGDRVVRRSLRMGAQLVLTQAKALAPSNTGALKRALRVANSRINNGRRRVDVIGLYLNIRKGKGRKDPRDAFYGKFQERGWNVRGKRKSHFRVAAAMVALGMRKSGRASMPGSHTIPGKKFIGGAYEDMRVEAARRIVAAARAGAESVARRTGLK